MSNGYKFKQFLVAVRNLDYNITHPRLTYGSSKIENVNILYLYLYN